MSKRKLSNAEVREIQLRILDDVDAFCRKNNIRYSLAYGTLLGAVRHKGYIPWDDDIDILMPRPDYERFLSSYKSDLNGIIADFFPKNPDYVSTFAKVYDSRTYTKSPNIIDDRHIFIDIFPIDGVPTIEEDSDYYKNIVNVIEDIRRAGKYYRYVTGLKNKAIFFIKYCIKRLNTPSLAKSHAKAAAYAKKYPFDSSKFAGFQDGASPERLIPREIYEEYDDILFEGHKLRSIKETDKYLTSCYGDYMKLPPEDQRIPTHFHEVYIEE